MPTTNFRTTVLDGVGVRASGLFSVDAVLPTAGTRNLVFTPTSLQRHRGPRHLHRPRASGQRGLHGASGDPRGRDAARGDAGGLPGGKLARFAKGHIGPNQHLVATVDGVAVQVQQDSESPPWDDGTVWGARTVWAMPAAVAAETKKMVAVSVAAGAPNRTPWITPQALVAAHDYRIVASGGELGATVLTASLRDIVTNFQRDAWGDNPMGGWDVPVSGPLQVIVRGWRYVDAWRKLWLYVTANVNGDIEVMGLVTQPNYNGPAIAGAANQTRMVAAYEAFQDSTRIHAWGGPNDPRTGPVPASSFAGDVLAYTAVAGLRRGMCVVLAPASGGTLPANLTAGTPYWLGDNFSGLTLHASRADAGTQSSPLAFGAAGTGNIIVTPMLSTHPFAGSVLAMPDGRPVRIGTPRVDIGIGWDEDYLSRGAKLVPCYPQDASLVRYPSQAPGTLYYPQDVPNGYWLNDYGDDPPDDRVGLINLTAVLACSAPTTPHSSRKPGGARRPGRTIRSTSRTRPAGGCSWPTTARTMPAGAIPAWA